MATIGLLKVAALKLALPLLRAAGKIEGVAKRAETAAADYEKRLEAERSRLD
jgi:ABC-type Fe3+-hydroxamate transport system substrate-binding protein